MKLLIFMIVGFLSLMVSIKLSGQEITSIQDSFKVSGSAGIQLTSYSSNGIQQRRKPFSYLLNGSINLSKGDFSIPLSFTYSEQERSFSQPFNQFGIAPTYKWIKAYIGYQNITWSKFSLAGHQLLGGGVELTPGKFRIGFVAGRFQRATGIDTTKVRTYLPAYKRTGFAAKIGYGTETSFIDFVYMRSKDDDSSLPTQYMDSATMVQPGKNDVLAVKTQLKIASFMNVYGEAAVSVFNRNIKALEKAPSDDWKALSNIVGAQTIATHIYFGMEAGTNFNFKGQNLSLFYKRIAPDFQSMGAYFIENDLNAYGIRHSFGFWQNKAQVNYGMSIYSDNLLNKKPVTTYRYQPNINLSLNPAQSWGLDVSWMDLYTKQKDGFIAVNDTIIMQNRNPGFTISPRVNWGNTSLYHMIVASYMNMRMVDNNAFTAAYMEYSTQIINLMYNLSLLQSQASIFVGINHTKNITNAFTETGNGGSIGYNQSWQEGKITANAALGLQASDINKNYNINAGLNYNLKKRHNFGINISFLNNKSNNINSQNFTEFTGVLRYTINF